MTESELHLCHCWNRSVRLAGKKRRRRAEEVLTALARGRSGGSLPDAVGRNGGEERRLLQKKLILWRKRP